MTTVVELKAELNRVEAERTRLANQAYSLRYRLENFGKTVQDRIWTLYRMDNTTVAMKVLSDGRVAVGRAYHNVKDRFSRKTGRATAHNRLKGLLKNAFEGGLETAIYIPPMKARPIFILEYEYSGAFHPEENEFYHDVILPAITQDEEDLEVSVG